MALTTNYWQQTLEEFNLHGDIGGEDTVEVMILIKVTGFYILQK